MLQLSPVTGQAAGQRIVGGDEQAEQDGTAGAGHRAINPHSRRLQEEKGEMAEGFPGADNLAVREKKLCKICELALKA